MKAAQTFFGHDVLRSKRSGGRFRLTMLALLLCSGLAGCSTTQTDGEDIADPFQGMNRAVFAFNDVADQAVLRPVAKGYRAAVPQPA